MGDQEAVCDVVVQMVASREQALIDEIEKKNERPRVQKLEAQETQLDALFSMFTDAAQLLKETLEKEEQMEQSNSSNIYNVVVVIKLKKQLEECLQQSNMISVNPQAAATNGFEFQKPKPKNVGPHILRTY